MRSARQLLVGVAALSILGCATPTLRPAPDVQQPGNQDVGVAQSEQVELVAEVDAWSAFPPALEQRLTPVRVTLINNSDRPVELKYEHFALSGFDSVVYHPLPPVDIEGTVTQRAHPSIIVPRFAHRGFIVAPYFYPYYDPYFVAADPWAYHALDPFYYRRYYPLWEVDLPTRDMRELAIPEGVVEPNGRVSGYLYFPELEAAQEGERAILTAQLIDAKQRQQFGEITLPFVVE